jgi:sodium transport system permease protein
MNHFITIFRKEFTDTIRDRRTLLVMVIFPLLLVPLMLTIVTNIQIASVRKAEDKVLRVGLVTNANGAGLADALRHVPGLRIIEGMPADSLQSLIMHDSLDAAVAIAPDFDPEVNLLRSGLVRLYYKSSEDYDMVKRRLSAVLDGFEKDLVARRFTTLKVDPAIVKAVRVEEHDVASMQERIGKSVGGMLPYLFVIFCFMGSMYPAIDLAAGEKERGTMETLLTAPVTRWQILLGKFCVVVLAGLFSALVAIVGILVAIRGIQNIPPEILSLVMSILNVRTVLLILSLLLPLSVFFAAFLLSLSIFAKSYKEAQSIISPLTIVVILPVVIGVMPGIALDPVTAMIPVLNVSLATKDIISGTIKPMLLAEVYGTLVLLAALSLFGCARWFDREETIFRGV